MEFCNRRNCMVSPCLKLGFAILSLQWQIGLLEPGGGGGDGNIHSSSLVEFNTSATSVVRDKGVNSKSQRTAARVSFLFTTRWIYGWIHKSNDCLMKHIYNIESRCFPSFQGRQEINLFVIWREIQKAWLYPHIKSVIWFNRNSLVRTFLHRAAKTQHREDWVCSWGMCQ